MRVKHLAVIAALGASISGGCAHAQPEPGAIASPLQLTYRGTTLLPATTTDQHGQSFTIAGLSGITWLGPATGGVNASDFVAVMDNSNKLVKLRIAFAPNGAATSVVVTGGLSLSVSRDFEGIAPGDLDWSGHVRTLLVSEEDSPAVLEFRLSDGLLVRTIAPPTVFANRRANFGFESCSMSGGVLWAANEEALSVDGPVSTTGAGTVVRLLRYHMNALTPAATRQYAYRTQPIHGAAISGARSGVSELVALPDGRVLALERSFALSGAGFFQARVYELNFAGATEVSGFTAGLAGQSYSVVSKRLMWSGNVNNMEGLAMGPILGSNVGPEPSGRSFAMVGIVDNGDPVSKSAIVAFELGGYRPLIVSETTPTPAFLPSPPREPK